MKKIMLLMTGLALISTAAVAKKLPKDDVPQAVRNEFHSRYPDAKRECWKQDENTSLYEVKFKDEGEKYCATYDAQGQWMETAMYVKMSDLPQPVRNTIHGEFADYKVKESEMVMDAEVGTCYEVELKRGDARWDVVMTEQGRVIEQTLIPDEDGALSMNR